MHRPLSPVSPIWRGAKGRTGEGTSTGHAARSPEGCRSACNASALLRNAATLYNASRQRKISIWSAPAQSWTPSGRRMSSSHSSSSKMAAGTTVDEGDPIREVAGVSAAEILARCARIRGVTAGSSEGSAFHGFVLGRMTEVVEGSQQKVWRLSHFTDGSNEDFVRLAHVALLGRPATEKEIGKRLNQLSSGGTRLGILTRLLFSRECRKYNPRVSGFLFLSLKNLARYGQKIGKKMPIGGTVRKSRSGIDLKELKVNEVPVLESVVETLTSLSKVGRMQRDIAELKDEIRRLNERIQQ